MDILFAQLWSRKSNPVGAILNIYTAAHRIKMKNCQPVKLIEFSTHLKVCLATTNQNFAWVKIVSLWVTIVNEIQACENYSYHYFFNLKCLNAHFMSKSWCLNAHFNPITTQYPANTRLRPNVGLRLAQRLRRWPDISPTLSQRHVFSA